MAGIANAAAVFVAANHGITDKLTQSGLWSALKIHRIHALQQRLVKINFGPAITT